MMRLHDYFRSSASYRVRIALNLKGIAYESVPHDLRVGAHRQAEYATVNPQKLLPTLESDGLTIPQSIAIICHLDEAYPDPPLLPSDTAGRARVRMLAFAVACDIHPLNNLRVLQYLESDIGCTADMVSRWYRHWVATGFEGIEQQLSSSADTGRFCHGETPTLADICLVPQVFNARRFEVDLSPYPTIQRVAGNAAALSEFTAAHPDRHQPW